MRFWPKSFTGFCQEFAKTLGASGLALLLTPGLAFACALPPSVILTLPTGHYITAAALTVALTALMGAAAQRLRRPGRPGLRAVRRGRGPGRSWHRIRSGSGASSCP